MDFDPNANDTEMGDYYSECGDYETALKYYRRAAENGDADAMNCIGYAYTYGEGVEVDLKEAFKWFKRAAEKGYMNAQFNMGKCYEEGDGVEKDIDTALEWYNKAAAQGDWYAKNAIEKIKNPDNDDKD